MKIRSLVLAIATLATVASAHAGITAVNYGSYTVSYDDSTIFGAPTFNSGGGAGAVGFGWDIPTSVNAISTSEALVSTFQLPDFTITANSGWSLSGPFTASVGNLIFVETGGLTNMLAGGSVSVDGGPGNSFGGQLDRMLITLAPGLTVGYYSGTATVPLGPFSSLAVSGGELQLMVFGGPLGGTATIAAQPQNKISFGFVAAPVPEPESYAMLLAGLAVVGSMARRRRQD